MLAWQLMIRSVFGMTVLHWRCYTDSSQCRHHCTGTNFIDRHLAPWRTLYALIRKGYSGVTRCLVKVTHTDHGVWSSHFSICLSIYIYLSCYFVSNQHCVSKHYQWFKETTEYFIFASRDKFKKHKSVRFNKRSNLCFYENTYVLKLFVTLLLTVTQ
jgi:hypothetical protein